MLPFQDRSLNVLCSPILSCTPARRTSMRRMHVRQYYQERALNPRTTGHFRASTRLRSQKVECCRSGTLLGCVMHDPDRSRSSGIADGSLTARQRMTRMMIMGIVSARTCLLTVPSATGCSRWSPNARRRWASLRFLECLDRSSPAKTCGTRRCHFFKQSLLHFWLMSTACMHPLPLPVYFLFINVKMAISVLFINFSSLPLFILKFLVAVAGC